MSEKVFEMVDATSDEQYYTIGIWLTLEAALEALNTRGNNAPGDNLEDEIKIIEIREREVGVIDWSENGKVVAKIIWRKIYREADDSYEWRREESAQKLFANNESLK